jgi:hypothetical protein
MNNSGFTFVLSVIVSSVSFIGLIMVFILPQVFENPARSFERNRSRIQKLKLGFFLGLVMGLLFFLMVS